MESRARRAARGHWRRAGAVIGGVLLVLLALAGAGLTPGSSSGDRGARDDALDRAAIGLRPGSAAARVGVAAGVGTLEGVVLDRAGSPAPGATVYLDGDATTSSDHEGRFRFDDVALGRRTLVASSGELTSLPVDLFVTPDRPLSPTLRLRAGIVLEVEIIDRAQSMPIAGATSFLTIERYGSTLRYDAPPADAQGRVRFPAVPFGAVSLHAEAPGYVAADQFLMGHDQQGLTWRARIVLERGTTLQGLVVDAMGAAVAAADVIWHASRGPSATRAAVVTDDLGAFEIVVPPRSALDLRVEHPSYESTTYRHEEVARGDFVRIEVRTGEVVTGQVVDAGGIPVLGASVSTVAPGAPGGRRTITDERGEFVLRGLSPRHVARFLYAETDRSRSEPTSIPAVAGEPVTIELVHEAVAAGSVSYFDGAPASRVAVRFQRRIEESDADPLGSGSTLWLCGEVVTDDGGRFEIRGLAPGAYTAMVVAAPEGDGTLAVPLRSSQTLRAGVIDHQFVLPEPVIITGRVVDASGRPIPTFTVGFAGTSSDIRSLDGRFRLGPLSPSPERATLSIRIEAEGYVPAELEIDPRAGADAGDIRLTSGHTVRGRVTDLAGQGIDRGLVVVTGLEREVIVRTDELGAFVATVEQLPVIVQAVEVGVGTSRAHEVSAVSSALELRVPETGHVEVRFEISTAADARPALAMTAVSPAPGAFTLLSLARVPGDPAVFAGDVPPGVYRINGSGSFSPSPSDLGFVTVEAGRTSIVEVPAPPSNPFTNEGDPR